MWKLKLKPGTNMMVWCDDTPLPRKLLKKIVRGLRRVYAHLMFRRWSRRALKDMQLVAGALPRRRWEYVIDSNGSFASEIGGDAWIRWREPIADAD